MTRRPARPAAQGLESRPTQKEEKTENIPRGSESNPPGPRVPDARCCWLKRKVGNAPLTPRGAGRKPRYLQGLEHPGPGAHAHSPEYGSRRRLPAREMAGTMRMGLTAEFWQPLMSDIQTLGLSEYLYRVRETGDKALRSPGHVIENDSSEYS